MRTCFLLLALLAGSSAFCEEVHTERTFSNGFEYIDLGLPSGTKWAVVNVGTDANNKGGLYFAWGEVAVKDDYSWYSYKHCDGGAMDLKKYNMSASNGVADMRNTLLPEDDVATVLWGEDWCMPSIEQFRELIRSCDWNWTLNYNETGVAGNIGQSKLNSQIIFFPAMGYKGTDRTYSVGDYGDYWTSSLDADDCGYALDYSFVSGSSSNFGNSRYIGQSVRAVLKNKE